ncbi:MAG: hypothetical protein Q9218_005138 [Villophora microphyllina]
MALAVDIKPGFYQPGSQVSGSVLLQGESSHNVACIKIIFSGRCKTKVTVAGYNNSRTYHRGRVALFSYEQVLFTGPYTLKPPHQWPFEFKFPERCSIQGGANFQDRPYFFDDNVNQPLPPSFDYGNSAFMGPDIESFVRYELEAVLVNPRNAFGNLSATKPLTLKGYRQEGDPDPRLHYISQGWTIQSLYLLPDYQDRKPTFGEKLKGKVHSGKMPKAHYLLKARVPTVGVVGQQLPLALGVSYDEDRSTTTTAPVVFLRKVIVSMTSRTAVRCANGSIWSTSDVIEETTDENVIAEKDFSDQMLEMSDRMEVGSLMGLTVRTRGFLSLTPTAPTFRTFNILRDYGLKVLIVTECGKQKRSSTFSSPGFVLLPEDIMPASAIDLVYENDLVETEDLPSYEAAMKT